MASIKIREDAELRIPVGNKRLVVRSRVNAFDKKGRKVKASEIEVFGEVDKDKVGIYPITYKYEDAELTLDFIIFDPNETVVEDDFDDNEIIKVVKNEKKDPNIISDKDKIDILHHYLGISDFLARITKKKERDSEMYSLLSRRVSMVAITQDMMRADFINDYYNEYREELLRYFPEKDLNFKNYPTDTISQKIKRMDVDFRLNSSKFLFAMSRKPKNKRD